MLNQREAYEVDLDAVFAAAQRHGKLLELNAHPHAAGSGRRGLCGGQEPRHSDRRSAPTRTSTDGLDVLRYGVLQARRGGLTKADVANTRTWPQLKKRIGVVAEK